MSLQKRIISKYLSSRDNIQDIWNYVDIETKSRFEHMVLRDITWDGVQDFARNKCQICDNLFIFTSYGTGRTQVFICMICNTIMCDACSRKNMFIIDATTPCSVCNHVGPQIICKKHERYTDLTYCLWHRYDFLQQI